MQRPGCGRVVIVARGLPENSRILQRAVSRNGHSDSRVSDGSGRGGDWGGIEAGVREFETVDCFFLPLHINIGAAWPAPDRKVENRKLRHGEGRLGGIGIPGAELSHGIAVQYIKVADLIGSDYRV